MENKESLMLERAYMFLEEGKWAQAKEYCDRILDENPRNAEAHLVKLLADCRVINKSALLRCEKQFWENINYKRVLQYGDEILVKELQEKARKQKWVLAEAVVAQNKIKDGRKQKFEDVTTIIGLTIGIFLMFFSVAALIRICLPITTSILVEIVISFILTIGVYLSFPIAYKKIIGGTARKKANIYAIINSIVCFLLFQIFYIIIEIDTTASGAVSFTYYIIGQWIMTSKQKN